MGIRKFHRRWICGGFARYQKGDDWSSTLANASDGRKFVKIGICIYSMDLLELSFRTSSIASGARGNHIVSYEMQPITYQRSDFKVFCHNHLIFHVNHKKPNLEFRSAPIN